MGKIKMTFALAALMALPLGFGSCSDDDDDDNNTGGGTGGGETTEINLAGHWYLDTNDDDLSASLSFDQGGNGKIVYEYSYYPGDDEFEIIASGTYTASQSSITANYSDVNVYTSTGSESYRGFRDGQAVRMAYTIVSNNGNVLTLRDNTGSTVRFEKN